MQLEGARLAALFAGALELEVAADDAVRPWRLPAEARRHAPGGLVLMSEFTAGVRLRLTTAATRLTLVVEVERLVAPGASAAAAPAAFVAVEADGTVLDRVDLAETGLIHERYGAIEREWDRPGTAPTTIELALGAAASPRLVELWLPQDAAVLLHGIDADATIEPAPADERPGWVHYGSSISHGGSADGPFGTWPALAARALGLDGINLGFGGNAMLDPAVARAIGASPASLITIKVGINIVGGDTMRVRTFVPALHAFLDLIRERQPSTPLVVISAIGCPAVEEIPGPIRAGADGRATGSPRERRPADGILTLGLSRELVERVVRERQADDPALAYLDGTGLLSPAEADLLPDGLHPGQPGLDLMAARFVAAARDQATELGRAFAGLRR